MQDELSPPERSGGDAAYAVAKAAIGSVPLVGSAGAELFAYVVTAPFEKRREKWMKDVGDTLAELRDRKAIEVDGLRDNAAFTDVVLSATQAALRTEDATKREALRNAVTNAALPNHPSEAVQQTYVRYVDELTSWHLRILDLFDDPVKWQARNSHAIPELYAGGLSHILEHAFPQLQGQRDLYDQLWRDLHARGLVGTDSLHGTMTGRGLLESRTTRGGRRFLQFIRDPLRAAS